MEEISLDVEAFFIAAALNDYRKSLPLSAIVR